MATAAFLESGKSKHVWPNDAMAIVVHSEESSDFANSQEDKKFAERGGYPPT
jgi:hypothetical protein